MEFSIVAVNMVVMSGEHSSSLLFGISTMENTIGSLEQSAGLGGKLLFSFWK